MILMSQHRPPGFRKDPCRDIIMRLRQRRSGWGRPPGRVATSARPACARPAHAKRATCAGCARDMRATSLLCAQQRPRPGFWVCALCTQPSFVT